MKMMSVVTNYAKKIMPAQSSKPTRHLRVCFEKLKPTRHICPPRTISGRIKTVPADKREYATEANHPRRNFHRHQNNGCTLASAGC